MREVIPVTLPVTVETVSPASIRVKENTAGNGSAGCRRAADHKARDGEL